MIMEYILNVNIFKEMDKYTICRNRQIAIPTKIIYARIEKN